MNVERLAKHVEDLCRVNDIEVGRHSSGGRAYRRSRKIKIRPVKSDVTYAIALHEIGHILGPRQSGLRVDKEVGAWEWARAHALQWTPKMNATMRKCLDSYLRRALSPYSSMKAPDRSHPIFSMGR